MRILFWGSMQGLLSNNALNSGIRYIIIYTVLYWAHSHPSNYSSEPFSQPNHYKHEKYWLPTLNDDYIQTPIVGNMFFLVHTINIIQSNCSYLNIRIQDIKLNQTIQNKNYITFVIMTLWSMRLVVELISGLFRFMPRKNNVRVTMKFEVVKWHVPTNFAMGEVKEVLWQKNAGAHGKEMLF